MTNDMMGGTYIAWAAQLLCRWILRIRGLDDVGTCTSAGTRMCVDMMYLTGDEYDG
jgi:hypothetical protein